ncbi:hypothetical protein CAPTEDRAFT_110919, partial [Capitella teleta]
KDEIQAALDDMENMGIISKLPQGQPTEWLSSLAYARKSNGKLRVCLDPRDMNRAMKRTYIPPSANNRRNYIHVQAMRS